VVSWSLLKLLHVGLSCLGALYLDYPRAVAALLHVAVLLPPRHSPRAVAALLHPVVPLLSPRHSPRAVAALLHLAVPLLPPRHSPRAVAALLHPVVPLLPPRHSPRAVAALLHLAVPLLPPRHSPRAVAALLQLAVPLPLGHFPRAVAALLHLAVPLPPPRQKRRLVSLLVSHVVACDSVVTAEKLHLVDPVVVVKSFQILKKKRLSCRFRSRSPWRSFSFPSTPCCFSVVTCNCQYQQGHYFDDQLSLSQRHHT
jgi:hypothetical protein